MNARVYVACAFAFACNAIIGNEASITSRRGCNRRRSICRHVVSSATRADSLAVIDAPLTIGAISASGSNTLAGLLDEVAVYDKALTSAQVAAHFAAATGR